MARFDSDSNADNFTHRHRSALILGFEGDYLGSLLALSVLVDEKPFDPHLRFDRAMTLMLLGRHEEGCVDLRRILEIDPNLARAIKQAVYC